MEFQTPWSTNNRFYRKKYGAPMMRRGPAPPFGWLRVVSNVEPQREPMDLYFSAPKH